MYGTLVLLQSDTPVLDHSIPACFVLDCNRAGISHTCKDSCGPSYRDLKACERRHPTIYEKGVNLGELIEKSQEELKSQRAKR